MLRSVPRLWADTIEAHRQEVRDAVLDATAERVAERGVRSVTMTEIAEATGIGRATLYKYFADVESILLAWHERQIAGHLAQLASIRDESDDPGERLECVARRYAHIVHATRQHHGSELGAFLHRDTQIARAEDQLLGMISELIAAAADAGDVRRDVQPNELAAFCVHALGAAGSCSSKKGVDRLVDVVLRGVGLDT
jgi:AcrR family transcriptional regulator